MENEAAGGLAGEATPEVDNNIEQESTTHPQPVEEAAPAAPQGESTAEPRKEEEKSGDLPGSKRKKIQIERLNQENAFLKEQLAKFQPQEQAKPSADPKEPDIADYDNALDFVLAKQKFDLEQTLKQRDSTHAEQLKQHQAQIQYQKNQDSFNERAIAMDPDYFEKASSLYDQGLVTAELENEIIAQPDGEKIGMYLINNPQELMQFQGLNDKQTAIKLARIGAKLDSTPALRQTKATAPITPVKPSGSSTKNPAEMPQADFEKWLYEGRR